MSIRNYSNTSVPVALTSDVTAGTTSLPVTATASFPDAPFTIAIERGVQANEEICLVTTVPDGTTLTAERGYDETTAKPHDANKPVEHCVIAQDYREANEHANDSAMHQAAPTGVVLPWMAEAASVPAGWLLCDGSAVSRVTYDDLHALLKDVGGTDAYKYGAGDGSTTFNVPDMRGRTIVGLDNMGGSSANRVVSPQADIVGGTAGAELHTLTTGEMPAHTHIQNPHTHVQNPHTHNLKQNLFTGGSGSGFLTSTHLNPAYTTTSNVLNTTATNQNTTATNQNAGGGAPHNNMPPYMAAAWIIKA